MMPLEQFFYRNPEHRSNCVSVRNLMLQYPDLRFYRPNPETAPWHWKCDDGAVAVNVWPHLVKGNREGSKAAIGVNALWKLFEFALTTKGHSVEDISLIE